MTLSQEPILIIDDDKLVLISLERMMVQEGYKVYTATSGKEALEILSDTPVDLILCDYRMSDMNGVEILQRAMELQPDAIRIILTANIDQETVVHAVNIGQISQFLNKPWDDSSLRQTIKASVERFCLQKEMKEMQSLIVDHHKELARTHKTLKEQLELGGKIQETLLLGKVPSDVPGIKVVATTVPSLEIDGDFYEFYRPLHDVLDIVVGDVMGKGIPAALVGTAIKTQLLRFAVPPVHPITFDRETYWHEDVLTLKQVIANAHEAVTDDLIKLEYFVSLFYARFDLKKRTVTFVDCGFTKPIHYSARAGKCRFLQGDNLPMGTLREVNYQPIEVPFEQGDIILFYSDGVTEAKSPAGELFDRELLLKIVQTHADNPIDDLVNFIKREVVRFHGSEIFEDDLTMIAVKVEQVLKINDRPSGKYKYASDYSQLYAVRDLVEKECHNCPGDHEKMSQDLKLAINEIFCNIVKHGYKQKIGGSIVIQFEHDHDGLKVEISDQGAVFDPLKLTEPNLFGDKEDGFGWYIVRQLVDEVMYLPKQNDGGWNHLRLYKRYFMGEESMEIDHTVKNHVLIITPLGTNLDAKESSDFKERVLRLINDNKSHHVIVDLNQVTFIDSSGLGSFLSILRRLNSEGGDLKLSSMTKAVRSMFELVSMHKIFEIFNSTDDALHAIEVTSR